MSQSPRRFRILVVLTGSAQTGGGFHQSATNLRMIIKKSPPDFEIQVLDVNGNFREAIREAIASGRLNPENVLHLPKKLKTLNDRVVASPRLIYKLARWWLAINDQKVGMSPVARFLDNSDADLVYFASPAPVATELQQKPFVWTIWDLSHLDSPEFPELRTSQKFEDREQFNSLALRKAVLIVAESQGLIERIRVGFGVGSKKFVTIPLSPSTALDPSSSGRENLPVEIRELKSPYVFYPAQLWTHKNHVRIAEAIALLNSQGHDFHAVFVGKDHGAGPAIMRRITDLGISDHIHFLGYVADEAIPALYTHASALVMASYVGPTNIPPLEAFVMGVPVIASRVHEEQLHEGALYFDPDDPEELAQALLDCQDDKTRKNLVASGTKRLKELELLTESGEDALVRSLSRLSKRIL